jgi:recombinational DNA repair protein RecR
MMKNFIMIIRKNKDVKWYERPSTFTFRYKVLEENNVFVSSIGVG